MTERSNGRKFPAWICVILMVVGFFFFTVLYQVIIQLLQNLCGYNSTGSGMWDYVMMECSLLLSVLTSAFILSKLEGRKFMALGWSLRGHRADGGYGALTAVAVYAVGFGVSLFAGWVEVTSCRFDFLSLAVSFCFFILVALTEEVMMRGYILGCLLDTRLNKFVALLISSVLFASLHLFNPNIAFLPMLNLTLAGILLGVPYLYTRNLWFSIGLHLFWNWIQGPVLGYQVSGTQSFPSLLQLRLSEDVLWNGGAFGFEGSLACTLLIMVCVMLIVWWGEKREAIRLVERQSC